ncbi:MAG TPA: cyclodeaminase/cyclohydrolase family protein [Actinomycetota bacterium]|nr:cyclodeaminase/cyclohydrolase family protein [Actinomycetota bacterium]
MSEGRFGAMTVDAFLQGMGSKDPTPGGGAAAAAAGAIGAALISMVGRLTQGRRGFEDLEERMAAMVQRADEARTEFLALGERDAEAFEAVMTAFRLPKETDVERAERAAAIQRGLEGAAAVPLEIARRAVDLMELAEDATAMGNPNASSDGMTAAGMLFASVLGAKANVEINATSLEDETRRHALLDEVAGIRSRAGLLLEQCREAFGLRLTG